MKYAESGGTYNGSLHDANGDGSDDTIAYGHDVIKNKDINLYIGKMLSEEEGEKLLIEDLEERIPIDWLRDVEKGGHQFTANEIDALVSLNYATYAINLQKSPKFANLLKGEYTDLEVYEEFMTYDKNSAHSGLLKRHNAEATLFITGIYDMSFYDKEIEPCIK